MLGCCILSAASMDPITSYSEQQFKGNLLSKIL